MLNHSMGNTGVEVNVRLVDVMQLGVKLIVFPFHFPVA